MNSKIEYTDIREKDLHSFDKQLYKAIQRGTLEEVKKLLQSVIFKLFYVKEWRFKRKHWSSSTTFARTHTPLSVALRRDISFSVEEADRRRQKYGIIKLLLKTKSCRYGFLKEVIHSGIKNLDIFHLTIDLRYKDTKPDSEHDEILLCLLECGWIKEFYYILKIFDINIYNFFHDKNRILVDSKGFFSFPILELCRGAQSKSVIHLLESYDKDTLNIFCNDLTNHKCICHNRSPCDDDCLQFDRYPPKKITCPEQHLAYELLLESNWQEPLDDIRSRQCKKLILKKLLELKYLQGKAIFNVDEPCVSIYPSRQKALKIQYKTPMLLDCAYTFGDECDIEQIETLYKNIIGKDKTDVLSLKTAVSYFISGFIHSSIYHRNVSVDYLINKINSLVERIGYIWNQELTYNSPIYHDKLLLYTIEKQCLFRKIMSMPLFSKSILLLYQKIEIDVNRVFCDSDYRSMLDILLGRFKYWYEYSYYNPRPIIHRVFWIDEEFNISDIMKTETDIINIMFTAGEKSLCEESIRLNELKTKDECNIEDDDEFNKLYVPCKICPYRGPGEEFWIEPMIVDLLHSDKYMPNLFEISRKAIRDRIQECNPHLNLYKATRTLNLPEILLNALLFNRTKNY